MLDVGGDLVGWGHYTYVPTLTWMPKLPHSGRDPTCAQYVGSVVSAAGGVAL